MRAAPSFVARRQPFKVEILDDLAAPRRRERSPLPPTSTYEHGDSSTCARVPTFASTGRIGPFKLMTVAGAYWRGSEKRPMLQRIYGTVWPTQEALDAYLLRRGGSEAPRPSTPGRAAGSIQLPRRPARVRPSGTPRASACGESWKRRSARSRIGAATRRSAPPMLVHRSCGSSRATGPTTRTACSVLESEGQIFSLKPMKLPPRGTFVYKSRLRSYRTCRCVSPSSGGCIGTSAPGRFRPDARPAISSRTTPTYTSARTSFRTRSKPYSARSTKCTAGSASEPRFTFGTRPDKALGDPALWKRAEAQIKAALDSLGKPYRLKPKDGAFYAPKIDIQIEDALGREWQTATIQVDLVMLPERFDLTYVDENGEHVRPVAIHRAIYGSLEALHRRANRALSPGLSGLVAPGPGRRHPHRRSACRSGQGAGRAARRTAGCGQSRRLGHRMQNKIRRLRSRSSLHARPR